MFGISFVGLRVHEDGDNNKMQRLRETGKSIDLLYVFPPDCVLGCGGGGGGGIDLFVVQHKPTNPVYTWLTTHTRVLIKTVT